MLRSCFLASAFTALAVPAIAGSDTGVIEARPQRAAAARIAR